MPTVAEVKRQLAELMAKLDPDVVPGPTAAAMVTELAAIEKLAQAGRVLLARRVAESRAWESSGERTAADWLARQAGTSVADAAGVLETSKQVRGLGSTTDALRHGKLSAGQAKAVAHGAAADPSAEAELLEVAQTDTFKGLRDRSAAMAAAATDDGFRQRRIRARRRFGWGIDDEGAFWASLRGPAADGVMLTSLLKPFQEQAFRTASAAGDRTSTFDNRNYDAFMTAVAVLRQQFGVDPAAAPEAPECSSRDADETAPVSSAEVPSASPSRVPPPRLPGGNNTKVIVLIDHTALVRGRTVAGETCEVAGLGPVPASVVRDLLPDAFVAAVVKKGRDVVNVAHLGRGLNAYQRTAVEALGIRCSNLACNQSIAIQFDHRVPWIDDKVTKLDNQDPLCPNCHRKKTHHGWRLEPGAGRRRFLPPGSPPGPELPARSSPDDPCRQRPRHRQPVTLFDG